MLASRLLIAAALLALAGAAQAENAPPGAAGCSGCHATGGGVSTSIPRIAGRPAAELVAAMQEFKTGRRPATLMDRIAKGFSDDEIKAIADWYGAQKN